MKHDESDYRFARKASAGALVGAIVVLLAADVLSPGFKVDLPVLVALLLTIGGLLSVDLPLMKG